MRHAVIAIHVLVCSFSAPLAWAGPQNQPGQPASLNHDGVPLGDWVASAPGKYARKNGTEHIELKPDGTFSFERGGKTYFGTYKVQGDTITTRIDHMVTTSSFRFSGDKMVGEKVGDVWEREDVRLSDVPNGAAYAPSASVGKRPRKTVAQHVATAQSQQGQPASVGDDSAAGSVQGTYVRRGKSGDYLELGSDGKCSLLQDGHSVRGNYKVQGDTIILTSPQMGGQTKAHRIGETIRDDDGIVWERASEPPAEGDASDDKPLSVDDILKATTGASGEASNGPGKKAAGSSGQAPAGSKPFTNKDVVALVKAGLGDKIVINKVRSMPGDNLDTSTEALIRLKKAGVSKDVIDAMLTRTAAQ